MPLVSTYLGTKYMHCDTMHFVQTILKLTLFYMHFLKLCIYNKGGRPGFNDDPLGSFHLYSILLVLKTVHSGQKMEKRVLNFLIGQIHLVLNKTLMDDTSVKRAQIKTFLCFIQFCWNLVKL